MNITQSAIQSEGTSQSWQSTFQQSEVSLTVTRQTAAVEQDAAQTEVDISASGLAAQQTDAVSSEGASAAIDPHLQVLLAILEALTGRKIVIYGSTDALSSVSSAATPASSGNSVNWSLRLETTLVHEEAQAASYHSTGQVTTADGRQISFALDLTMQRYEREESTTSVSMSSIPRTQDPLVLNIGSVATTLEGTRFSFDLDSDGTEESLANLGAGSVFLALDRNGNGSIDNGSELFGTASGDGFADLAALDSDGNGWIDENDPAFSQLQVWRPDTTAQSLAQAGVGALSLAHVSTDFTLKADGATTGVIRSTGMFLMEDGAARTAQQVDLVV